MSTTGTGPDAGARVQIRTGVRHPLLGDIGGWEGTVMRSFTAGGRVYVDMEVAHATIAGLSPQARGRFYNRRAVFTRVRVPESDTQPLPAAGIQASGKTMSATPQAEWFDEVGTHESDPTRFVADRASGKGVDLARREVMRSLVGVAAFMIVLSLFMQRDCNSGTSGGGSWGRSGGFSS